MNGSIAIEAECIIVSPAALKHMRQRRSELDELWQLAGHYIDKYGADHLEGQLQLREPFGNIDAIILGLAEIVGDTDSSQPEN